MAFVSIVVPVYHNASSLRELLARFQALAAAKPQDGFEFVFVDDGSRDDSYSVLLELARSEPRLRIIKLSRNFGSNPAILAGLMHARGEAIAAIAADLQDPPELIGDMLEKWRLGKKVVLAARSTRDDPGLTSHLADLFYWLFRRFAIRTMPRRGFDFFLIDRRVADLIKGIQESNAYLMGLILWLGFDPEVIHYARQKREDRHGRSMWTFTKRIKYFIDSFVAFSYIPIRLASLLGVCLSLLGLVAVIEVLATRIFFNIPVQGWTSLIIVLLVVSGAQLLMTGILGEYLWRTLEETRRRPRYVVENIVEADQAILEPPASPAGSAAA
jgi:dolichol-phosphate mannosyltransferase